MICTINLAQKPVAQISVGKNIQKVYDGKIYLEDNTEFQLMFFNPTQKKILAKIYLNDELISFSGLVLRPGERIWLDRFLDQPKKFKFETYFADDTPEGLKSIEKNGQVKIEFFNESSPRQLLCDNYGWWANSNSNIPPTWVNPFDVTNPWVVTTTSGKTTDSANFVGGCLSSEIKTGRVEGGNYSDQKFQTVNSEFDSYPFEKICYQILPLSKKNFVTTKDLVKRCQSCGKKIKSGRAIYCSNCGTKL